MESQGRSQSLKEVVSEQILRPLIREEKKQTIQSGKKLAKETPKSIILYGPPGTSKTQLAKIIAENLGWPFLLIDSSQFLKNGMDKVYAEADTIFGMLAITERILVLLDEFDEMVRERESAPDVLSRFLTTAMLPKLNRIYENRRLVFIVATNHLEWFDVAIRRPGRFDLVLQVNPPTADAKLAKAEWSELAELISQTPDPSRSRLDLTRLTYTETDDLVAGLKKATTREKKLETLEAAFRDCTLLKQTNPQEAESVSWETQCDQQKTWTRTR